ncbi:PREDICTED: cysteine sulfinic acid decarboxylase [Dufourea novaeangliae]|uniref:Glutamate decarboxylase-like protein 1 n=1 Tax=Dufourea novaeangliae TaxID=178035 RepID=A0A154PAD6_DUFNO|nr:PREDICTED: cysteine sulfinic acid decarboxylase [Dufourea novaeangliae]KZC08803.1 Glutamate decarboxylase-like protein 1 [Dufourea novaeangliae]
MPANEETIGESVPQTVENFLGQDAGTTMGQMGDNLLEKVSGNSVTILQNNLAGTSLDDTRKDGPGFIDTEDCCYKSLPVRQLHEKFMRSFVDLLLEEAIFKGTSRENRVVEWMDPASLHSAIDLTLTDQGCSHEKLFTLASNVIKYSVKTGHPRFVNQLYSSVDPYGLLGQWLTDSLNPSVYTYEVSPVFSLMEEELLREMRKLVGWKDGRGDGIFCPGGSIANGYAINLARHYRFPQLKESGLSNAGRLIVFTSQDSHYSVKKLSAFLGIGNSNVYEVKTDAKGKMSVADLEAQIQRAVSEGATPLMVSATAGTTVLGAYDPLTDIAAICGKYNLWFHVDAAWGGGALVSRRHRYLLDGVELADSVTWNPHKLLAAPQQCSTLLVRHEGLLQAAHGSNASYLFQPDKFYDTSYDSGDKHVQCGRRADVLKFWFMWKAKGTQGLESHVDRVFQLARYFTDHMKHRDGFELLLEPECTNVCFWYVPPSKRHLNGEELSKALQKIGPTVKERMVKKGSMLITYQPLRELPNFFRLVLQNSGLTEGDMRFFVEEIERLGSDL